MPGKIYYSFGKLPITGTPMLVEDVYWSRDILRDGGYTVHAIILL